MRNERAHDNISKLNILYGICRCLILRTNKSSVRGFISMWQNGTTIKLYFPENFAGILEQWFANLLWSSRNELLITGFEEHYSCKCTGEFMVFGNDHKVMCLVVFNNNYWLDINLQIKALFLGLCRKVTWDHETSRTDWLITGLETIREYALRCVLRRYGIFILIPHTRSTLRNRTFVLKISHTLATNFWLQATSRIYSTFSNLFVSSCRGGFRLRRCCR